MRSWSADWHTGARPKEGTAIPIAPSLYSLSNKIGNSLLAVRDINHKYIVVGREGRLCAGRVNICREDETRKTGGPHPECFLL